MTSLDEQSLLSDRYSVYEDSRPCAHRSDRKEVWFFEPADCRSVLDSPNLSSRRTGLAIRADQAGLPALGEFFRQWLMYTDGDEHLQRRSAVVRALRQIGLDVEVELPTLSIGDEFDLVEDFCEPFVWHVLPQLLGLNGEERDFWKPRIARLVSLPGSENPEPDEMRLAEAGLYELHDYLLKRPCRLLSALWLDIGENTDLPAMINLAINVIGDGMHPTIAGLGSEIFLRLTSESDERRGSSQNLYFHYEPPFQFAARVASEPGVIREIPIEVGQRVVACLAAANRASVNSGWVDRPMTFGHGRHACIGRAHAEKCIRSGLTTFNELSKGAARVAGQPRWTRSIGYRMIESVRIQLN
jgi:cytochrome P450